MICKSCHREIQGDEVLTMAGVEIPECQWCAALRTGIIDTWGLDKELLKSLKDLRREINL